MHHATPTDTQRAGLRRFEDAFGRWSAATGALAAAELRLWAETLRDPRGEAPTALAQEVLRLRAAAADAYRALPEANQASVARTH